ncbi:cyclic nucleotide-gated ion channel [Thalassospiraceae bacterium LMO-JJ14]|nr:cyclic nucleotide-gated ion channel [Thalassospiraceae bacterium LMO-JJ14]
MTNVLKSFRHRIYLLIEAGHPDDKGARIFDALMVALIVSNVITAVLETEASIHAVYGNWFQVFEMLTICIFTFEYLLRIWVSVEHGPVARHGAFIGRLRFAMGPYLLIDLLAIAPVYLSLLFPVVDLRVLRIFRLLRLLKLARYSPALHTLTRVLVAERHALGAALVVMMGLLVLCSTLVFHFEHDVQPEKFSSIPAAMWWGLATLTTVGYGDVVPITLFGKIIGGMMMVFGLGMFALPLGIVASAFSRDIHQRDFVVTFGMVANVPAFQHLSPKEMERLIRLLRARRMPAGSTVFSRGDIGDAMYFIVYGKVGVELPGHTIELTDGDFFGEMALHKEAPRRARVHCLTDCRLLMLEKDDFLTLAKNDPHFNNKIVDTINAREETFAAKLNADPRS